MPVSTVEPKDPFQVWDFKALSKRGSQEALALLHRIAKQVQPVMRKRGWRVPLLSEFSPKSPNLLGLNINGGGGNTSEIKIRLRPHNTESRFFPYEHLLGTMLHELVHNVQGPHNAVFYKLLDEITESAQRHFVADALGHSVTNVCHLVQECEGFMAKGITGSGAGFDAPSMGRLGGRGPVPIHNPPAHKLKSAALKAAEARSKKQSLMPAGPRKLGGDLSLLTSLTPAQAAARAAERRARDNVWCPCGDHGTGIGYTNDNGGVIILDNASSQMEKTDQRGSGCGKAPQSSSDTSVQANMPCDTTASSSAANGSSRDAQLLAAGSHNRSLLHSSQQQHLHQGDRTAGEVASLASHNMQEQPMARVARTTAGWEPGSSSSDLVDLTLDDADALPTHRPKSKRQRAVLAAQSDLLASNAAN
ncbi:hypothetical protein ABBQ38_015428 [Trebouxia sp. C0009 RCD-2024]